MKAFLVGLVCATSVAVAQTKGGALKSEKDQVSYSLGVSIGQNFRIQKVDLDISLVARGIKDGLTNGKLAMTEQEIDACMTKFQTEMIAKQEEERKLAVSKNQAEGEKFLAQNKTQPGVVTTASGLQYKVIKLGTGRMPKAADTVEVNYRGTTLDGKEFDSSYKYGQTSTFALHRMIRGWIEGLQLMPQGSKFQFFVPAGLAYGDRGSGPDIGPGAALIFEVELVSIK